MRQWMIQRLKRREFLILMAFSIIFAVLLILLAKVEMSGNIPHYGSHIGHAGEEQFIYHLQEGQVIEQEFSSPRDFDFATINFSDHDTTISGKTFLTVLDQKTGEILEYQEIANPDIHYGQPVQFLQEGGKEGVTYLVRLQFEGMGENGLGIYGYRSDKEGAAVDGDLSEYAVGVGTHSYTNIFKILVAAVMGGILFQIVLATILVSQTNLKEEYLFLGIAIPIGMIFLCSQPGNPVHDGETHLAKTYHYSNFLMGRGEGDSGNYVYLEAGEAEAFNGTGTDYRRENNIAYELWENVVDLQKKTSNDELVKSDEFRGTSASSFLEYFPGAIGITAGRILGVSARMNLVIAKAMFFLFYIGAVFLAIRISPYLKMGMAFCALLPMAMYQATGITYDSVVAAIAFLLTALYFKMREETLSGWEMALYYAAAVILGCCKGGFYLVLLLPFLFIPAMRFGGKRRKALLCIGGLAAGGAAMFLVSFDAYWSMLTGIFHVQSGTAAAVSETAASTATAVGTLQEIVPETQTAAYGISYLFHSFPGFLKLFIRTMADRAEFYLGGLIGYRMAWTDETISWIVLLLFCLLIAASAVKTEKEYPQRVSLCDRLLCLGVAGLEIFAFHALMLIETPENAQVITGVQGRYFLALTPLILLMIYNGRRKCSDTGMRRLFYFYACVEGMYMYSFLKIFLAI